MVIPIIAPMMRILLGPSPRRIGFPRPPKKRLATPIESGETHSVTGSGCASGTGAQTLEMLTQTMAAGTAHFDSKQSLQPATYQLLSKPTRRD